MIKQIDVLRTLLVLSLASIVCLLIFDLQWLLWLAIGFLVISLKQNPLADFIAKLWLKLSEYIGGFMSKVILSVIFFLLLTPIAMLYRLFNRDMKNYFFDRSSTSTFHKADVTKRNSFEHPW